jgi:hypothetical protein
VALNGSGQATFRTAGLPPGAEPLTAVYNGSANFLASSSAAVSQTVNPDATVTTVKASPNPAIFGQTVTLTAIVRAAAPGSGTPGGSVTFKDSGHVLGAATLVSGQATFTTASLAMGNHALSASYGGDLRFTASTSGLYGEKVTAHAGALESRALTMFPTPRTAATPAEARLSAVNPTAALSVINVDAFFDLHPSTNTTALSFRHRPKRTLALTEDWA